MLKKNYSILFLFITFAFLFNSCSSDSDEVTQLLEVELIADGKIDYKGGEFFVRITTNGNWEIEKSTSDNWYSVSSYSGTGNQTVILKVLENENQERSGELKVSTSSIERLVTFTQDEFDEENLYYPSKEAYRIEIPRLSKDLIENKAAFVPHYTQDNVGEVTLNYSLEYNYDTHHTRWVAFTFYNKTAESNTKRSNAWSTDPSLIQWTDNASDYRGSGYDRGHLVASADRLYSRSANEQTFYYSNMSPQIHSFNGGIWANLEETVRSWGRLSAIRDTLYVVKGGTIDKDRVLGTIGDNKIVIPKYYYMAVLSKKGANYKSIGFWLEHKSYERPYQLENYALSIKDLEEKTDINFFHNLPDEIESKVEDEFIINDWPGL